MIGIESFINISFLVKFSAEMSKYKKVSGIDLKCVLKVRNRFSEEKYLEFGNSIPEWMGKCFYNLPQLQQTSWPEFPDSESASVHVLRRKICALQTQSGESEEILNSRFHSIYCLLFQYFQIPADLKYSHRAPRRKYFCESLVFNFLLAKLFERALKCEPINVISHFQQNVKSTKEGI